MFTYINFEDVTRLANEIAKISKDDVFSPQEKLKLIDTRLKELNEDIEEFKTY